MKYYENVFASGRIVSNSEKIEKKVMDTNSRGTDQDSLVFKLESAYVGTLTVNFVGYGGLKNIVSTECYIQLFEKSTNETYIKYILQTINDNTSTNHTKDIKIKNLPAGEYVLIAKLPDNLGSGKGYVSGVLKLSTFVDTTSREIETYGGGLRIKAIASYEQGGKLLEKTEYKYTQEDGKTTSGIHVNPTRLDFVKNILTFQSGKYTAMTDYKILRLTSGTSGMTAFAAAMSPNDVCYSRVTKTKYTKNTDKKLKEISHYELYPLQLNLNNYLCSDMKLYNGNLSRKEYYDESDRLVRTETYSYKQDPYRYYKVNAKLDNALTIIGGTMSIAGTVYENYCHSFKSCWNRLVSIMQTDYRYDEVCNGMVEDNYTFTSFTYDPANKQISSKSISSHGTAYVGQKTSYIYSHTKSSMASQYLMNAVLQQTDSIISPMGNSVMKNQKIEYSNPREGVFLLSSVRDSIEGDMEERVHYGYDNNGNVNYILKDGTDQVVYLWSYSGSYPVAKIEGLTYSSVSNKLTSSFVSDLYSKIKPTESDYETIRTSLSSIGGLVTTYTYKPLVGVASQTLPNGVKTQFYYDGFGRLTETKDGKGKVISSIKYHTK